MAERAKQPSDTLDAAAGEAPLPPAARRVLVALFLLLLLYPGGQLALRLLHAKVQERFAANSQDPDKYKDKDNDRPPARQPGESWTHYFENHFAGRELLIRGNAYLKVGLLHTSTTPKVLIGQHGWLFYADEHGVEDVRNQEPFSDAQLQAWGSYLSELHDFAAAHQIRFVLVFAPNKQTIYPEHLPAWATKLGPQSRLDQLLGYLRPRRNMAIADLREPLRSRKSEAQLYHRSDSHWNRVGELLGYREVTRQLHALHPGFAVLDLDDFRPTTDILPGGDLARMLGAPLLFRETIPWLGRKHPRQATLRPAESLIAHEPQPLSLQLSENADAAVPRAVIYHDSFFRLLNSLIAQEVGRGVFIRSVEVDYSLLLREQPDVLILEMVERRLFGEAPRPRPPQQSSRH